MDNRKWNELSLREQSDIMAVAVRHGITSLQDIRDKWNEFAEGGEMPDTVGEYADAIYQNAVEEPYGDPSPHYDNVDTELIQRLVPDVRGHYDDAVKLPNHPSSPVRGTFNGRYFDLTDEGMQNPNYTLFGLIDNGDADTTLRHNGSYVLPEVTVTPEGNYYDDAYNNIRIMPWDSKVLNQHAYGGHIYKRGGKVSQRNQRAGYAVDYFVNKGLSREQAAGLVGNLMRESQMNTEAVNPASGAYGLGQWLGERKTRLFKKYGNHPTFYNQLDYIWDELNSTHKKGLKMLKSSKTVDDAARNAFGYYEFSAGPEAAVAAMNRNGMKTKWKNPNGTVALNDGINNAWVAYGKASPKAKLGLNVKAPILGYQRQLPQFDFEGIGDEIADIGYNQPSSFNVSDALAQGLIPSNPTDYGTPVDYNSLIRTTEEPKEEEVFKDDNGMGLLTLMSNLGIFGEQQQEPLSSYTLPKNNNPFVVSAPTYNDTLLDDSWFANGGSLYRKPNFFAIGGPEGVTRTVGSEGNETAYHIAPEDYTDFLNHNYTVLLPEVEVKAANPANYRSSYDPEGFMDFMNIATLGLPNRLSLSQNLGVAKDAKSGMPLMDLANRAIMGNDGVFESPYANLALDLATPLGVEGIANASKIGQTAKSLGSAAWHSTYAQYPRYYLGKLYYGRDVELPTLYRKLGDIPQVNNGRMQLSPIYNRFAFETGEESPLITNVTSDVPVRSHGDNWDKFDVLAFPGKTLLGKHVVSTRPSDTFTYGDILTIDPKKVIYISGKPRALRIAEQRGMNTLTSQGAKDAISKHNFGSNNDYFDYAKALQNLTRSNFKSPTLKDYKFMDWVFQPQYGSRVYPFQDLSNPTISELEAMPQGFAELLTSVKYRRFLSNPEEWRNVLYHPASTVEARFRKSKGIMLKDEIPAFKNN